MFKAPYRRREEHARPSRANGRTAEPELPPPASDGPSPRVRLSRRSRRAPLGLRLPGRLEFTWTVGMSLAVLSFGLNILWAAAIRPLAAPDEPAHLLAVLQVRVFHILPEVHYDFSTDPHGQVINTPIDAAAREYISAQGFGQGVRGIPNESVQPPLYYVLAGVLAAPFPDNPQTILYLSRLLAALCGAGMVYFCWAATHELAPQAPQWAIATAGAVMLLPQFCFNSSTVSNDSLLYGLSTAAFCVWLRGLRHPAYDPWMLKAGALAGLAVLTKMSALALLPGLALVVLFRAFQAVPGGQGRARIKRGLLMSLGAVGAILAVLGWWPVRNLLTYGEPTSLQGAVAYAHANYPLLDLQNTEVQARFLLATWESFWGVFGWMDNRLPSDFYDQARLVTAGLVGLTAIAALLWLGRQVIGRRGWGPAYRWQGALILGVVSVTVVVSYVQFSVSVAFQAQARYLFVALLPAALLFTGGLCALVPGRRLKALALSLPLLWLALMNAVGLAQIH